ncbi:tubulin epsilon and delta complex protein 1 [Xenentodon cancila]
MQRSKAAVNVEVKQVIGALCKLLGAAGLNAIPAPEAFRRAKFGGGAEEDQFWQLLTNFLQTAGMVSSDDSTQLEGERRKLVAAGLWHTGYHADWMYRRDGDDAKSFSSRDLLLALGWLLAAGALEKLLTRRVQQLDKTLLTSVSVKSELSSEFHVDSTSLRRLQWLVGRLRHQGRTLLSMIQERSQALHALFSASVSTSASSSSGRQSSALQEDCVCLQQLCDLLEAYLKWKQVEKVFWTWMESVVDCHLMDPHVRRSSVAPSPGVCHHGHQGLEKLENMLVRLPEAEVCNTHAQEAERQGCSQDRCGSAHLPPPASSLPSSPPIPQACRAVLRAEKQTQHCRDPVEGSVGSDAGAPHEFPVSEAAELLRHAEEQLLQRRSRQRLVNRIQLQEMIGQLEELVLIPL